MNGPLFSWRDLLLFPLVFKCPNSKKSCVTKFFKMQTVTDNKLPET